MYKNFRLITYDPNEKWVLIIAFLVPSVFLLCCACIFIICWFCTSFSDAKPDGNLKKKLFILFLEMKSLKKFNFSWNNTDWLPNLNWSNNEIKKCYKGPLIIYNKWPVTLVRKFKFNIFK